MQHKLKQCKELVEQNPSWLNPEKPVCGQSILNRKFSTDELFIYLGLPEAEFPELQFTLHILAVLCSLWLFFGGKCDQGLYAAEKPGILGISF